MENMHFALTLCSVPLLHQRLKIDGRPRDFLSAAIHQCLTILSFFSVFLPKFELRMVTPTNYHRQNTNMENVVTNKHELEIFLEISMRIWFFCCLNVLQNTIKQNENFISQTSAKNYFWILLVLYRVQLQVLQVGYEHYQYGLKVENTWKWLKSIE